MWGSVDGKLLRGDIKVRGFLLKVGQVSQVLRVQNEKFDQISKVISRVGDSL